MSPKKQLEIINEFSIVAGYKINVQKSGAFLHPHYKVTERENQKTTSFIIASKNKTPRNKFKLGV